MINSFTGIGFNPSLGSKEGNAVCPFCGTVVDSNYVKSEAQANRFGQQMMVVVCKRKGVKGKVYISSDDLTDYLPNEGVILSRINDICSGSDFNELQRSTNSANFSQTKMCMGKQV